MGDDAAERVSAAPDRYAACRPRSKFARFPRSDFRAVDYVVTVTVVVLIVLVALVIARRGRV
jgi:hypothetical protein